MDAARLGLEEQWEQARRLRACPHHWRDVPKWKLCDGSEERCAQCWERALRLLSE